MGTPALEQADEVGPGYLLRAHADEVCGQYLAIDELETPFRESPAQVDEGHLGGVADAGEHGFAEEHPADGHPIEPSGQCAVLPDLDGVGEPPTMEPPISGNHLRDQPGTTAAGAGSGTGGDNGIEIPVHGGAESALA